MFPSIPGRGDTGFHRSILRYKRVTFRYVPERTFVASLCLDSLLKMSRYPPIMEIEQCEPESTFIDDVSKLFSFVKTHDNSFAEYVRVARMYLFGTPIRRTGAAFRRATPGWGYSFLVVAWLLRARCEVLLSLTHWQMHPVKIVLE